MSEYSIQMDIMDTYAAFMAEGRTARADRMVGTAERQEAKALHIQNAANHLRPLAPVGYRLQARLVFEFVADVNPVLRPELQAHKATELSADIADRLNALGA